MATSDPSSRKPVPTRLVLLDQIKSQDPGTKIRFLGCVYEYQGDSATLLLKANFEKRDFVKVNVQNVLESANHETLSVGMWLNVVGYVREAPTVKEVPKQFAGKTRQRRVRLNAATVDAIMIWSAGAVKLDKYQSAVRGYQETGLTSL